MVSQLEGLDAFREHFGAFTNEYVVIGGAACSILMSAESLEFRSTKDIDMILILEAEKHADFGKAFWDFIKRGGYVCGERKRDKTCFYRFTEPQGSYPVQIELLSRSPEPLTIPEGIRRVHIDDDVSSLSAIILDEKYYRLLENGCEIKDGIRVLKVEYLILFKMFARMNLKAAKERYRESGNKSDFVNDKDYKKHKNDVFRLLQIVPPDLRLDLPEKIRNDVKQFLDHVSEEPPDLKALGISMEVNEAMEMLRNVYLK